MFPFDISGTIRIATTLRSNSATVKAVANRIAAMLDEKECDEVLIESNRVRFRNKWFGGTIRFGWGQYRYDLLNSFGTGTFDIEAAIDGITVRFALSLARTWILVGLFAAIFFGIVAPRELLTWDTVWPFPAAFLLGGAVLNYAITWGRVWYWLRRGLEGVSELSMKA